MKSFVIYSRTPKTPARRLRTIGNLINTNTIDAFKEFDKKALLHKYADQVMIITGTHDKKS